MRLNETDFLFSLTLSEDACIIKGMAPNQAFLTELAAGRPSHIGNIEQGDHGTRRQKDRVWVVSPIWLHPPNTCGHPDAFAVTPGENSRLRTAWAACGAVDLGFFGANVIPQHITAERIDIADTALAFGIAASRRIADARDAAVESDRSARAGGAAILLGLGGADVVPKHVTAKQVT